MRVALVLVVALGCGGDKKPANEPFVTLEGPGDPPSTSSPISPPIRGTQPDPVEPAPRTPRASKPKPAGPIALVKIEKVTGTKAQVDIAARLAWEAGELYAKASYAEASSKLREACARVPEGRYFYNLCASLYQEGKYSVALTACDAVSKQEPTAELQTMTDDLSAWIADAAKAEGVNVAP